MNDIYVLNRLQDIFREVFDDGCIVITRETTPMEIEKWDSFMHVVLLNVIQREFDVTLSMEDILKIKSVGDIADRIVSHD